MISKASVQYVRISPRKVRYVIDPIRNQSVPKAQAILSGSPRRASTIVRKLLDQAVDAAKKNSKVDGAQLVVSKVFADGGPMMKRYRAATMGRASMIRKRTSHIHLELALSKKKVAVPGAEAAGAAPEPAAKKTTSKKLAGAK